MSRDKFVSSPELFATLQKLISNLPPYAISIDLHLDAEELPEVTVKYHPRIPESEDDLSGVTQKFRLVAIEPVEEPTL